MNISLILNHELYSNSASCPINVLFLAQEPTWHLAIMSPSSPPIWDLLSLPLSFMIFNSCRGPDQVFCIVSFNLGFMFSLLTNLNS